MYASEAQRLAKISANLYNGARALDIKAKCCQALGNYTYAASLCKRGRDLLAYCGMSGGTLDSSIMNAQAEIHKFKSEYSEARNIQTQILHGRPIELVPQEHAITLINIAELDVWLGHLVSEMICDAIMGALHLRDGNQLSAKSLFHKCLSFFWGNYAELVNYCLERLADRSLWDSTDWSWTILYLVHASKLQHKLDVHKALQFLGDFFRAKDDQDTAASLLTVALEGFTQMDVHCSRAECMLQLGYISKEHGDILKAAELWRTARPLFKRSSQAKKVALIDEELFSIPRDVLDEHTRTLELLAEMHAPSAANETTTGSLVEATEETEDPGLGGEKVLVPILIQGNRPRFSSIKSTPSQIFPAITTLDFQTHMKHLIEALVEGHWADMAESVISGKEMKAKYTSLKGETSRASTMGPTRGGGFGKDFQEILGSSRGVNKGDVPGTTQDGCCRYIIPTFCLDRIFLDYVNILD
ncbi:hypothetical protein DFH09DRAFT_1457823 [Mycena vulgaris]|nr:hypothetical protein DFH09DRAFT_1457823 [Mycena vulgaris]